jgi:DNA uptake protein ComE-like DNA-binding protein
MAARMHDINCASARHLEAFADIPRVLADKIVAYRKIRNRIFHIDKQRENKRNVLCNYI